MLNQSHPLSRYEANSGGNEKKCLMHFEPDARVFVLNKWYKIELCNKFSSVFFICLTLFSHGILWQIFFSILYMFDSISSIIVWTNKLHDFDEGICFPGYCCYENG